jgi:hypothetical protein
MNKWRKINTAPKHGVLVLLYGKGYMKTGFHDAAQQLNNYPHWRWGLTIEPTHWMPLPNPPKVS